MSQTKKLISNSLIIFIGTIIGSFFSYLFNMLMGRMLGPVHYGDLIAIMSFLAIISVFGSTILTITMRYAGETFSGNHLGSLKKMFKTFTKYTFIFGCLFFIVGLFFAKFTTHFFSIHSLIPVLISLITLITGFTILVNKGMLQGVQSFAPLSFIGSLEMFLRLALGVILVKIGLELNGAVSALVLSTAITYFISLIFIGKFFKKNPVSNADEEFIFDKKEIISYTGPTFLTILLLAISVNMDILIVKHYFPANEAGVYAAISTIGKIILYVTAPIISVMFPMISEHRIKGEKHYRLFFFSLLLTLLGSLTILGIYTVAPTLIIKILYGPSYVSSYGLLPIVGVMILFYSLINLMCNYYLAVKNFSFIWYYLATLCLQIILIYFFHNSILDVEKIFVFTLGLLFFALMSHYLYIKKDRIKEAIRGDFDY